MHQLPTLSVGRRSVHLATAMLLGALACISVSACAPNTDDRTAFAGKGMPPSQPGWVHTSNEPNWQGTEYKTMP
jgi:hypothetical protein